MDTCSVYGYIVDGSGKPLNGIKINFIPSRFPAVYSDLGIGICPMPIECITTSSGFFETKLLRSIEFTVIINALGIKENIIVPEVESKNLFELISSNVVGPPNGSNNW